MEKLIQERIENLTRRRDQMLTLVQKSREEGLYSTEQYFDGRRESYDEAIQELQYLLREVVFHSA